jgi:hypothetical protein
MHISLAVQVLSGSPQNFIHVPLTHDSSGAQQLFPQSGVEQHLLPFIFSLSQH